MTSESTFAIASRLRAEAAALVDDARRRSASLLALADQADGTMPREDDPMIDTPRARAISRKSSSWLYKAAIRYDFGWQIKTGSWMYSERRLRAFLGGQSVTLCEESDGPCEESDGPCEEIDAAPSTPSRRVGIFDPTE